MGSPNIGKKKSKNSCQPLTLVWPFYSTIFNCPLPLETPKVPNLLEGGEAVDRRATEQLPQGRV